MRKISILNEDFMALEQAVASVLDGAQKEMETFRSELKEVVDAFFENITEEDEPFAQTAEFINFKNDPMISQYIKDDKITSEAVVMIQNIKKLQEVSLEQAALASVYYREYKGDTVENEMEELTYFFGGTENTDIPESSDNDFELKVMDAGRDKAIHCLGMMEQYVGEELRKYQKALSDNNVSLLYTALDRLRILDGLTSLSLTLA